MSRKILITGGAGFIGSNLAVALRKANPDCAVVCLDNLKSHAAAINVSRLKRYGAGLNHGDVRNAEDMAFDGLRPDMLIVCPPQPPLLFDKDVAPQYLLKTNLVGTVNCLEAARAWSAPVIFLSTARVYPVERLNSLKYTEEVTRFELEDAQDRPGASSAGINTDFPLVGYRSLYGAAMLASEHIITEYQYLYGVKGVINRCGEVAGPWQTGSIDRGVIAHWVASHYFQNQLQYRGFKGSGKQVTDLLHIDDLCRLILWQVDNIDSVNARVFNVGGGPGISLSLLEATDICAGLTGNRVDVGVVDMENEAEVRIYLTDIAEVCEATGWAPRKGPVEILRDIYMWIRSNEGVVRNLPRAS